LFGDLVLDHTGTTPNRVRGTDMHNEYLDWDEQVLIFKAVSVKNKKLSNIGDYVAYKGEEEVHMTVQ